MKRLFVIGVIACSLPVPVVLAYSVDQWDGFARIAEKARESLSEHQFPNCEVVGWACITEGKASIPQDKAPDDTIVMYPEKDIVVVACGKKVSYVTRQTLYEELAQTADDSEAKLLIRSAEHSYRQLKARAPQLYQSFWDSRK